MFPRFVLHSTSGRLELLLFWAEKTLLLGLFPLIGRGGGGILNPGDNGIYNPGENPYPSKEEARGLEGFSEEFPTILAVSQHTD